MLYVLGILTGVCISTLNVVVLIYFRHPITQKIKAKEVSISNAGPRPKGGFVVPMSEVQKFREGVIAKNQAEGKDTPIKDLI